MKKERLTKKLALFTALSLTGAMLAGIPVRMCLFHGENHELSRAGKPRCRMKRLAEITNWMDKYLKGERME